MWFKNALFVVSRSDMYIVSLQQTVHSALSRGFEPCYATGSSFFLLKIIHNAFVVFYSERLFVS